MLLSKLATSKFGSWLFFGLIGLLTITPYTVNGWWKFLPSVVAIVLLMRWKTQTYVSDLGLKISNAQAVVAVGVFTATIAIVKYAVLRLLNDAGRLTDSILWTMKSSGTCPRWSRGPILKMV
jgi:hypothetical protein